MAALIVDVSISQVADIVADQIVSMNGIILFVILAVIYGFGQYYILEIAKSKNRQTANIHTIHTKAITVTQCFLLILLSIVVVQILTFSYYHTVLLIISVVISYSMAALFMGMLAYKLFSWLRVNKSIIILLYGLAAVMILINALDSILLFDIVLLGKSQTITPQSEVIFEIGFNPGTVMSYVSSIQSNSYLAYFILTWAATVMIMRHNITRLGKIKFGAIVTLPIIYFLGYSLLLYPDIYPPSPITEAISSDFMIPLLLYTFSVTICGILFGIGFISISRVVKHARDVRDYMLITGFGFILFFNSAQATVLQASYPPFGLINVSFVALSAYLIFLGLYNSATSVANDVILRRYIKKSTLAATKLLDDIGTAQVNKAIEAKVVDLTKATADIMEKNTGVEPSLGVEEIRNYLNDVIKEVVKSRV